MQFLRPFLDKGFKVTAISPDFEYLFKKTVAESWFNRLIGGDVDPGEVSLGQNLSNLLRLALLYKFGGTYIDTDVIVLRSFKNLRNSIGAQTIDQETRNWSRLNNAVMVFDKGHPLLYKFIEEFALTFDGNKWGHNGPYLVSRVVSRVNGRPGFNFSVLPPRAFYPGAEYIICFGRLEMRAIQNGCFRSLCKFKVRATRCTFGISRVGGLKFKKKALSKGLC